MSPIDGPTSAVTTLAEDNAQVTALWGVADPLTEWVEKMQAQNEERREQLARRGKSSRTSSEDALLGLSPAQKAERPKKPRFERHQRAQLGTPSSTRASLGARGRSAVLGARAAPLHGDRRAVRIE